MPNKTENYELVKPFPSEFYDVEVHNGNMDKIDAGMKANADGIKGLQDEQKNKADLVDGKVPVGQLPAMDYEAKGTAASVVKTHNEDETAHPYLLDQIGTCVTAAKNAQEAADAALEVVSSIAFTIDVLPTQSGSLTYTGQVQSPAWNSYNPDTMVMGGVTSGTNAGTYTTTFTPKDNYRWRDGSTGAREVTWTIGRAAIYVPVQSGTLTYNGSTQIPSWSNYDSAKMTRGGTTSGINAGSYNATFTPGANYQWRDGTTAVKTVAWTIGKAAGSLTLNKSSISLSVAKLSDTIPVTRSGDGAISAVSSNTSVATVSVAGNVVTITAKAKGSATITVRVGAGTNYTAPANKTCSVSSTLPNANLTDNSWATIREVSRAGQGDNYWDVGDMKSIVINGKVGNTTISKLTINVFILGFNHNSAKEGRSLIHFQIGKIGTKAVALCDSHYDELIEGAGYFHLNDTRTNEGGWNGSSGRRILYGNSGSPSNLVSNSLMAALPSDLLAVMQPVIKYTDNVGGVWEAAHVTASTDYLFDLAEFEVFGLRTEANNAEQNYQLQYDYYKAGNSRVAYKHTAMDQVANWGLRSTFWSPTGRCIVYEGSIGVANAHRSVGLRPGFAV